MAGGLPLQEAGTCYVRDRVNGDDILVSINLEGTLPRFGGGFNPSITADGRHVVFQSSAGDLALNDSAPNVDVFLRDLTEGTTTLLSVRQQGVGGGFIDSFNPVITPDGRTVLFESQGNLVGGLAPNRRLNIFLRDLETGAMTLVSVNREGRLEGGDLDSHDPLITPDGRFVLFESRARNLVDVGLGWGHLYLRDLQEATTTLIPVDLSAGLRTSAPLLPAISGGGRYVAFQDDLDLVVNDQNGLLDVFVRDVNTQTTLLVSVNINGQASVTGASFRPLISADGRYVAFQSFASDLTPNGGGGLGLYVRDLQEGTTTLVQFGNDFRISLDGRSIFFDNDIIISKGFSDAPTTSRDGRFEVSLDLTDNGDFQVVARDWESDVIQLVSVNPAGDGAAVGDMDIPTISADGRFVAFESFDSDLPPDDRNHAYDVFVRDRTLDTVELVSRRDPGLPWLTAAGISSLGADSVSADGQVVAFVSRADNLTLNDANGLQDIFVHDLSAGTVMAVSLNSEGSSTGKGFSADPVISADGRYVAFVSNAIDLTPEKTNPSDDIFVRDLETETTSLVSVNLDGSSGGNGGSSSPIISAAGRFLAFTSRASDLVSILDSNDADDVFIRDRQTGDTILVSVNADGSGAGDDSSSAPVMSADGRFVAFLSSAKNLTIDLIPESPNAFVRDVQLGWTAWVGSASAPPVISGNGRYVAFQSSVDSMEMNDDNGVDDVFLRDLQTGDLKLISVNHLGTTSGSGASTTPRLSADGRFVAFVSEAKDLVPPTPRLYRRNVFRHDIQSGETILVSVGSDGNSDSPAMSANGRFVAFRSVADNPPDLPLSFHLRDLEMETTTSFSLNRSRAGAGLSVSARPIINADGGFVFFKSSVELAVGDYNNGQDVVYYRILPPGLDDSDGDGMDDAWERSHFGDLSHDGASDTDGDGQHDLDEFLAGSDPNDRESVFRGHPIDAPLDGKVTLTWNAVPGKTYHVQFKNDLNDPDWINLPIVVTASGATASVVDPTAGMSNQRYYRIVLQP